MKLTKKNKIIISAVSGIVAVTVIVTTILLTGGKTPLPVIPDPDTSKTSTNVVVNLPSDDPSGTETPTDKEKEDDDGLVIDVGGDPENPAGTGSSDNNDNPVKTPEKPVETQKPEQPADNSNGGGISIGGDDHDHAPYNCGVANHHCASPESHAFITNLEIEGCPICGSHSCPSFYALDQWGYTLYTPSKCPKYDIKNDPLYYCQDCGKKVGDGSNGTCVQFINACNCPLCGEYVPARTCHTCK
ncbi:MAG TPA: hypothetical protein DEP23_10415 [Ruminococcaceae bacterium]|nr:hypothetical protein [Oscillospiraceae bacterium]